MLSGRAAIVTGSGAGIGRAIAVQLADSGACVTLADVNEDSNQETRELIEDAGGEATAINCDVSNATEVEAAVQTATKQYSGVDILVNNAAISHNFQEVGEIDEELWNRIQSVNLKGSFLCTKYALPELTASESGSIINIGSTSALRPRLGLGAYVASKSGLIGLTKSLALDYADVGVRVNMVCPVATDTPLFRDKRSDEQIEAVRGTIPLGRLNQPEDVADAVTFLASNQAQMITGVILPVDGGRTI